MVLDNRRPSTDNHEAPHEAAKECPLKEISVTRKLYTMRTHAFCRHSIVLV